MNNFNGLVLNMPGEPGLTTKEGAPAWQEAIDYLKAATPVAALVWSDAIYLSAKDHCADQGPKGNTGHIGSAGSNPATRLAKYGDVGGGLGENISYGAKTSDRIIL